MSFEEFEDPARRQIKPLLGNAAFLLFAALLAFVARVILTGVSEHWKHDDPDAFAMWGLVLETGSEVAGIFCATLIAVLGLALFWHWVGVKEPKPQTLNTEDIRYVQNILQCLKAKAPDGSSKLIVQALVEEAGLQKLDTADILYIRRVIQSLRTIAPDGNSKRLVQYRSLISANEAVDSHSNLHEAFVEFGSRLDSEHTTPHIWSTLYEVLLKAQTRQLRQGRVSTSSSIYTNFLARSCRRLKVLYPEHTIELHLVTGMLPHEFFNWPQLGIVSGHGDAEGADEKRRVEVIPHTWTNSGSYFSEMKDISNEIHLCRHILVRQNDDVGRLPLRLTSELLDYKSRHIHPEPVDFGFLRKRKYAEIFRYTTPYTFEQADKFVGVRDFKFYPIAAKEDLHKANLPSQDLFHYFAESFHSSIANATYCEITPETMGTLDALITNAAAVPSHLPELAYFKVRARGEKKTNEEFAVLSELTPYTEAMEIHFIDNLKHRPKMVELIKALERDSKPLVDAA